MGGVLEKQDSDELTVAYCKTLFPQKKKLFSIQESSPPPASAVQSKEAVTPKVKGMSTRQLGAIGLSKAHYMLFLIATMARKPVPLEDLSSAYGKPGEFKKALADLVQVRLLRETKDGILPVSSEIRFPSADSNELRALYARLDLWDQDIGTDLNFKTSKKKFLFRRISPRYIEMIENHCQLIVDLIRSAEELDPAHNEDVVSFSIKLMKGRVPG